MWKTKLCLATSDQFELSVPEQIKLFKKIGFDGFFTDYTTHEDIAEYKKLADELDMIYQSVHAPFVRMNEMWEGGEEATAELIDCLHACEENSVPIMVVHAFKGYVGSGRNGLADRLFKLNARFVPLLNAALAFIVFVMSGPLMSFFTDNSDYISEARTIFLIDIIIETARGNTHLGENALCSTADTLFASVVTITSCIVFGAFGSWLLCIKFGFGLYGYFIASAIDEVVRGILFRVRWKSGRWSAAAKNIG